MFIAGPPALDFLNSTATPTDEVVDWIGNGEDYLAWLQAATLVSSSDLAVIRQTISPRDLDRAATQARMLREWFREFVLARKGKKLPPPAFADLERVNQLLEQDALFWRIVPIKAGPAIGRTASHKLSLERRWVASKSLLLPVAEAIANFICTADFREVKLCEGKTCTLLFLDETRRRARRWCSMAVCGNRAKQADHRKRVSGG